MNQIEKVGQKEIKERSEKFKKDGKNKQIDRDGKIDKSTETKLRQLI